MRTFHIGGAAERGAEQSSIEASVAATVQVQNRNVVTNSDGVLVVMGRNSELVLSDDQGRERARHRIPYGAKMPVDDGTKVEPGHRMAEWDPYTIPSLPEREGFAHSVDLVAGMSLREVTDDATALSSRAVVDGKQPP